MNDALMTALFLLLAPALAMLAATVGTLRRCRYSVGEFWLLITLAGLAIGLTALALPKRADLVPATLLALEVGAVLAWGGAWGLSAADRSGIEDPGERFNWLLRGLPLGPTLLGLVAAGLAVLGYLIAALVFAGQSRHPENRIGCLALAVLFAVLAAPFALYFFSTVGRFRRATRGPWRPGDPRPAPSELWRTWRGRLLDLAAFYLICVLVGLYDSPQLLTAAGLALLWSAGHTLHRAGWPADGSPAPFALFALGLIAFCLVDAWQATLGPSPPWPPLSTAFAVGAGVAWGGARGLWHAQVRGRTALRTQVRLAAQGIFFFLAVAGLCLLADWGKYVLPPLLTRALALGCLAYAIGYWLFDAHVRIAAAPARRLAVAARRHAAEARRREQLARQRERLAAARPGLELSESLAELPDAPAEAAADREAMAMLLGLGPSPEKEGGGTLTPTLPQRGRGPDEPDEPAAPAPTPVDGVDEVD